MYCITVYCVCAALQCTVYVLYYSVQCTEYSMKTVHSILVNHLFIYATVWYAVNLCPKLDINEYANCLLVLKINYYSSYILIFLEIYNLFGIQYLFLV